MLEIVRKEVRNYGDRLSAISIDRLVDVKSDFDKLNIDTSPYYSFEPPTDLGFAARSVLVVASPSPPVAASFYTNNGKRKILIPPTYVDYEKSETVVKNYLTSILRENGFHIASAYGLPCKPIAAHAGLGTYGRNNIIYVDGIGSFHRLNLFFSDIPCDYDLFYPLKWMSCCDSCYRCIKNCPTAALSYENNVVDGNRCLTWFNENDGDFPSWLNSKWHNALIGCVKCQYVCPQNENLINSEKEIANFNKEQTEAFINGELSDDIIMQLGMGYCSKILPRNLKVLLSQSE